MSKVFCTCRLIWCICQCLESDTILVLPVRPVSDNWQRSYKCYRSWGQTLLVMTNGYVQAWERPWRALSLSLEPWILSKMALACAGMSALVSFLKYFVDAFVPLFKSRQCGRPFAFRLGRGNAYIYLRIDGSPFNFSRFSLLLASKFYPYMFVSSFKHVGCHNAPAVYIDPYYSKNRLLVPALNFVLHFDSIHKVHQLGHVRCKCELWEKGDHNEFQ